jgi:hypothetical protein
VPWIAVLTIAALLGAVLGGATDRALHAIPAIGATLVYVALRLWFGTSVARFGAISSIAEPRIPRTRCRGRDQRDRRRGIRNGMGYALDDRLREILLASVRACRDHLDGQPQKLLSGAERHSISHALLATLPVREVATTNYDDLFEQACTAVGRPAAVLPYAPDRTRDRWVLKLHGTVEHPEEIVLTRDDYLAYGERRAALVQGLLITKHMLFLGFSLTDDNVHRIVHDVARRSVVGTTTHRSSAQPSCSMTTSCAVSCGRPIWRC